MNIPPVTLSAEGQWFGVALAVLVLAGVARHLPWYKVRGDAEAQRIFAVFVAVVILMRGLGTQAVLGVNLHFLGATVATLMFGPAFALVALAIISAAWALLGRAWLGWGWDFLCNGVLPVTTSVAVGQLMLRLPPQIFIYVLGNGFLAAVLAMAVTLFGKAALTAWLGGNAWPYFVASIPMSFAEGFFTGGIMALIVAYRPQWCASFDDDKYLARRD